MRRAQGGGRLPAAVSVAMSGVLLAGCAAASPGISGDAPDYPTVTALAEEADLVVAGSVGEVVAREIDDGGGSEDAASGVPMKFHRFHVKRVFAGERPAGDIVVAWLDVGDGFSPADGPGSRLERGASTVMFLHHVTESAGITSVPEFYVPIGGGDNAVFDIRGGHVRARSSLVEGLRPSRDRQVDGQRDHHPLLEVPLTDLETTVEGTGRASE